MASGRTAIRSRPYPLESDVPDVAADMELLANNLDTSPNLTSGVLSSRPAFTAVALGDEYYATDTFQWFRAISTAWLPMLIPGPWVTLNLGSGISAWGSAYTPAFRIEGDTVRLRGVFESSTAESGGFVVAAVSAAAAPAHEVILNATWEKIGSFGPTSLPLVIASGAINMEISTVSGSANIPSSTLVYLDGLSYTLS